MENVALVEYEHLLDYNGSRSFQVFIVIQVVVATISQVWLFRKFRAIYEQYNYVVGAGMDFGMTIRVLIIGFLGFADKNSFKTFWALNPNQAIDVPFDYYCYPGTTYMDFACDYVGYPNRTASFPTCGHPKSLSPMEYRTRISYT
ncbi:hypothetical protein HK100_003974 [Physocladia obscura]|uniref:Uncharacterized protein n=1 Tax=Physocladia obscura TaxID=109957 RepID=A0AAD5XE55_9FUNG|nr:hypothetical protein HK100_003974 [Physocladia obscura]